MNMSKKEKIKKWCKDHKTDIAYWTGGCIAIVGCIIGDKIYQKRHPGLVDIQNKNLYDVLMSSETTIDVKDTFTGIFDKPIKVNELGELGKQIIECGATENCAFTHFIVIGEHKQ